MSGGSLDYAAGRIDNIVELILGRSRDPLHVAFAKHLMKCSKAVHDLEWVLSDDYGPGDEVEAIQAVLSPHALLEHLVEEAEETHAALVKAIEEAKGLKTGK